MSNILKIGDFCTWRSPSLDCFDVYGQIIHLYDEEGYLSYESKYDHQRFRGYLVRCSLRYNNYDSLGPLSKRSFEKHPDCVLVRAISVVSKIEEPQQLNLFHKSATRETYINLINDDRKNKMLPPLNDKDWNDEDLKLECQRLGFSV